MCLPKGFLMDRKDITQADLDRSIWRVVSETYARDPRDV
jgi:hypothetical protein